MTVHFPASLSIALAIACKRTTAPINQSWVKSNLLSWCPLGQQKRQKSIKGRQVMIAGTPASTELRPKPEAWTIVGRDY